MTAPVPCDRCGTFTETAALRPRAGRWLCSACLERTKDVPLYPYGYAVALGVLFNFAVTAALLWKNARALEDEARGRTAATAFVVGLVFFLGYAAVPVEIPALLVFVPNIALTLWLAKPWQESLKAHKAAGGSRPGLVVPVLLSIGFAALIVAIGLATDALLWHPEEYR